MQDWKDRVRQDADDVYAIMLEEYASGTPIPFSINRLKDGKKRSRERVAAALTLLVFVDKKVGVAGDSADEAVFFPVRV